VALTAKRLKNLLSYDPKTGVFCWIKRRGSNAPAGSVAGCITRRGYRVIMIDHYQHLAHRLAWLHTHGRWPANQIDHINRDCADNRLVNLREATPAQNKANSPAPAHNTSGLKGAQFVSHVNRWQAAIVVAGRRKYLGRFATAEQAHAAYCRAAKEHFGEFARV